MNAESPNSIPENEQPVAPGGSWRRLRRRRIYYDPVNRVVWAGMLVMAGAILLADQLHLLPAYREAGPWSWIMLGAGGILLLAELTRAVSGDYGRPTGWQLIAGIVLVGIGASEVFGVRTELLWPAALIVVGLVLLVRNLAR